MTYSVRCFADVLGRLKEGGLDGVVIGSTAYALRLGVKEFEDDVDLFATSFSPISDEDMVYDVAERVGCQVGSSEWGTARLECIVGGECVVPVEFHENIHDFYIPPEVIEGAEALVLEGVEVKVIRVEDYILLKARAGRDQDLEDLGYISDLIRTGELKIDFKLIKNRLKLFDEDDRRLITRRLISVNVKI
ncbi:MAG: nucleotidyltransferase [Zestosphaera sp.]